MKGGLLVDNAFVHGEEKNLTVRKTSLFFAGDGFTVYDCKGTLVFRVDSYGGPNTRETDEVVLMGAHGRCLLTLRRKRASLRRRWEGYLGERSEGQKPIFGVRKSSIIGRSGVTVEAYGEQKCREYLIEGNFGQRSCTVVEAETRRKMADIRRKIDATTKMKLGKDVFSLNVKSGFDGAFAMGLVIVLDQIYGDDLAEDLVLNILVVSILGLAALSHGESVMKYGAIGDGIADDTHAFEKAWNDACNENSKTLGSVYVPSGKIFLVNSLHFIGPCLPKSLLFTIDGEMRAQSDPNKWQKGENGVIPWLIFDQVKGLIIVGRGLLDGQGKSWWDIHCRDHLGPNCIWLAPTMMTFSNCENVTLKSLRFKNSAQTHVLVMGSQNVYINDIRITSPEASPNTDGVHITSSSAVSISHSNIATGDDCVSIGDKVNNLNVTFVNCGPGHGVSIGSLGKGGSEVAVQDIRVWHVNFTGTTNGARIKTWPGGTGYVRGIEFFDIHFSSVQNPIIINQFYGCGSTCANQTRKAVHIEKVRYMKMSGTSATKVAMKLECSGQNVPCSNIFMRDIDLSPANGIDSLSSHCTFVHGSAQGIIRPSFCLNISDHNGSSR